jgi:hypothetical protein
MRTADRAPPPGLLWCRLTVTGERLNVKPTVVKKLCGSRSDEVATVRSTEVSTSELPVNRTLREFR